MPVITLTLSWHNHIATERPVRLAGWTIEICGSNQSIDMSAYKFVRKGTAPYLDDGTAKSDGRGPVGWILTPDQEPLLGETGLVTMTNFPHASMDKPPMGLLTCFLEALEEKGYHVTASHSVSFGNFNYGVGRVQSVWTLKYVPPQSVSSIC